MTDEELARIRKCVDHWHSVYGLYEEITVFEGDVDSPEIQCEAKYMRAVLTVPRQPPEGFWTQLDECISHEMAHAFMMEIAQWADTMEQYVSSRDREPLNDAWHLAWERTTERLARLARRLNGGG